MTTDQTVAKDLQDAFAAFSVTFHTLVCSGVSPSCIAASAAQLIGTVLSALPAHEVPEVRAGIARIIDTSERSCRTRASLL